MRTTIPLLQSAAAATTTTTTTTTPPTTTVLSLCLRTLHGTHLQRIAQRTGIHSSGTKPVLTRRLETELPQCEYQRAPSAGAPAPAAQGMSILSIDMGIRNLAFAHLLVAPPPPTPPLHSSGALKREEDAGDRHRPRITLTAWRRLSVFAPDSDFELQSQEPSQLHPETAVPLTTQNQTQTQTQTQTQIPDEASEPTEAHPPPSDPAPASDLDPDLDPDPSPEEEAGKVIGPYCPASYAEAAYALITTLLARYRPTHVLIERQRFRSGGRAPVQEWSIRVGVFEGMLYAVLEALRHERGAHPNSNSNSNSHAVGGPGPVPVPVPQVYGVEPGRVSRFWSGRVSPIHGEGEGKATGERKRRRRKVQQQQQQQQQQQTPPPPQADAPATAEDGAAEAATERPARKKKKSAGEVKKMKMDLVGHWLQNAAAATTTTTTSSSSSLAVADDQELHQWVEAYRTRWQTRRGAGAHLPEIGKLDDLADCLVQGVTWLEWQQMRHRLLVEPSLLLKI